MNPISSNPLRTRSDLVRAAVSLLEPLVPCLSPGRSRLLLGDTGAVYSEDIAGMEGFSRALWALVPLMAGRCPEAEPFWALWKEGIISGTDPENPEYWGDIGRYDQRMVEMAVMGMALCLIPERFYGELSPRQQDRLIAWLNQINLHDMPANNWRFFRILVNTGFLRVGRPVDEARLREDLDMMDAHYVGDGWYFDYETKRDYYTLWAFHYYSLVYSAVMREQDPERCARFLSRAREIAPRFACWFDREGRGLPYGRSLTYRFAQGAFFSALAFAGGDSPQLSWGQIRGLWLSNLRSWVRLPIFDRDGILTIGYGYPNLCAAEGYNAPGSPYWALKTFLALALPEEHPFWQSPEDSVSCPLRFLDPQVRLLLTRDPENRQVIAYTAGNHGWEHMHEDEKYEKFAYSTHFSFSVTKESSTLEKGAYDSMLALRRPGRDLWHVRSGCESFSLTENEVRCVWSPMTGVEVDTRILPAGNWHVRIHRIRSSEPLELAEGAFSVCRDRALGRPCDRIATQTQAGPDAALAWGPMGSSAIFALSGYTGARVVIPEPNTSLMYPRTVLPTLTASLPAGESLLSCAVLGTPDSLCPDCPPEEVIQIGHRLH